MKNDAQETHYMDRQTGCVPNVTFEAGSFAEAAELIDVAAKKLKRLKRHTIQNADLTPSQYSILGMLCEKDGRPLNELATACCCSRSTITGIIDTMEKNGLVARAANPGDRRSLLVMLSDKGRALANATPDLEGIFEGCCGGITAAEIRQLSRLLTKLNNAIPD